MAKIQYSNSLKSSSFVDSRLFILNIIVSNFETFPIYYKLSGKYLVGNDPVFQHYVNKS